MWVKEFDGEIYGIVVVKIVTKKDTEILVKYKLKKRGANG